LFLEKVRYVYVMSLSIHCGMPGFKDDFQSVLGQSRTDAFKHCKSHEQMIDHRNLSLKKIQA